MLRIIITFIIITSSYAWMYAQDDRNPTTVFYADGSIFNGQVVEEDETFMHLLLVTGDTIKLHKLLIDSKKSNEHVILTKRGRYHKKEGIFYSGEYGFGAGPSGSTVVLDAIIGKRLKPNLNVGLGIGYSYNSINGIGFWQDNTFVNLYGFGRYYFNNRKFRLFTEGKLGYGIKQDDDWAMYTSGFYTQPGVGFEIANRKRMKWSIKLSQFIQHTSGTNQIGDSFGNPVLFEYDHWFNRTMFTVGINF